MTRARRDRMHRVDAWSELDTDWMRQWIELDWVGLNWIGSNVGKKLGWIGLDWIGLWRMDDVILCYVWTKQAK